MIMRSEHPKPQFMRSTWENLNGKWQFQIVPLPKPVINLQKKYH